MKIYKDKIDDFFKWVKGTELVELDDIDVSEDPVRPELTLGFSITHGRKIFGLKYNDEIERLFVLHCVQKYHLLLEKWITCHSNEPRWSASEIVIAYTVWSRKRGAGKEIIKKLSEWAKENNFKRLVTLSPLTPMATHFHIRNGAKQIHINEETQNFEYKIYMSMYGDLMYLRHIWQSKIILL